MRQRIMLLQCNMCPDPEATTTKIGEIARFKAKLPPPGALGLSAVVAFFLRRGNK